MIFTSDVLVYVGDGDERLPIDRDAAASDLDVHKVLPVAGFLRASDSATVSPRSGSTNDAKPLG